MTPADLHTAALAAGATLLGEGPHHYLFSEEQLVAFLAGSEEASEVSAPLPIYGGIDHSRSPCWRTEPALPPLPY